MKPPRMVISMMNMVTNFIPSWKSLLSGPDIIDPAFKLPQKRQEVLYFNFLYTSSINYDFFLVTNNLWILKSIVSSFGRRDSLTFIKKQIRENPNCYNGRPRMKTMSELYRVSVDLENRLHEVIYRIKVMLRL